MRVCYLLEGTELFGGVKVVLQQAGLLATSGLDVVVASKGSRPDWIELECDFVEVPVFEPGTVPPADVTVATYWTTIAPALDAATGEVVHYCQGFEASYTHNTAEHAEILAAYGQPLPALCVASHLEALLRERFGRPARVVLQPLERHWHPAVDARDPRRSLRPRVLVVGAFEIDWKGVATALRAVRALRTRFDVELVRLSPWPLTDAERRLVEPDSFHCHVPPERAAEIVAGCDLMLAASWEQEGFGLPVLEAMASGVPVVASDISAYRDFASTAATLVEAADPDSFARAATRLLEDESAWAEQRALGLKVAEAYSERSATASARRALEWVASGAWRSELAQLRTS